MNLLEAMELDAPATVTLTGPIVKGDVHVRYALASDLSRTIRFGTDNFSNADIVKVRGVEWALAGMYFVQRDGAWNRVGFDGIRRPDSYKSEVPAKTWKVIIEALVVQATRLGEQFPNAFVRLGAGDLYSVATSARRASEQLAADVVLFDKYADIAEGVDDGTYTVRRIEPGDGTPEEIRWNKPRSRDFHMSQADVRQPGRIVGLVEDHGRRGPVLLGYAVDTGTRHDPDCYHGPLLVPLDCAVDVNKNTTSW